MKQQPFFLKLGGKERPALFTEKSHELFTDMQLDLKFFLKTEATTVNYDVLALVTILLQNGLVNENKPVPFWWEQVMVWLNESNDLEKDLILKTITKQGLAYWSHGNRLN